MMIGNSERFARVLSAKLKVLTPTGVFWLAVKFVNEATELGDSAYMYHGYGYYWQPCSANGHAHDDWCGPYDNVADALVDGGAYEPWYDLSCFAR